MNTRKRKSTFQTNAEKDKVRVDFLRQPSLLRLRGRIQNYSWGGLDYIAQLTGQRNDERRPLAELWLGAHPHAPALAELGGVEVALDELIAANPVKLLGSRVARMLGGKLPFLFKVLDVREMLSIQVHPTLAQAQRGFARENRQRIPLAAGKRNYKDPFHKPEMHIALTDFWMLHGFRPFAQIVQMLRSVPAFQPLAVFAGTPAARSLDQRKKIQWLYAHIMTMPSSESDAMLSTLYRWLLDLQQKRDLDKNEPHYWALAAFKQFPATKARWDRGLFSIYLLNLLHIPAGRGTFQPAQVPHAYLQGVTVELMANSDNVLRGGLSEKYVDVPEMLKTLSFAGGAPRLIQGRNISPAERRYRVPFSGFELSRIALQPGRRYQRRSFHGPEILLMMDGEAWIHSRDLSLSLDRGDAIFAPANVPYIVRSDQAAVLFKAGIPL